MMAVACDDKGDTTPTGESKTVITKMSNVMQTYQMDEEGDPVIDEEGLPVMVDFEYMTYVVAYEKKEPVSITITGNDPYTPGASQSNVIAIAKNENVYTFSENDSRFMDVLLENGRVKSTTEPDYDGVDATVEWTYNDLGNVTSLSMGGVSSPFAYFSNGYYVGMMQPYKYGTFANKSGVDYGMTIELVQIAPTLGCLCLLGWVGTPSPYVLEGYDTGSDDLDDSMGGGPLNLKNGAEETAVLDANGDGLVDAIVLPGYMGDTTWTFEYATL